MTSHSRDGKKNPPQSIHAPPVTHTASPVMKEPWIKPIPCPIQTTPTRHSTTPMTIATTSGRYSDQAYGGCRWNNS